jgi:hypothetical protein
MKFLLRRRNGAEQSNATGPAGNKSVKLRDELSNISSNIQFSGISISSSYKDPRVTYIANTFVDQ